MADLLQANGKVIAMGAILAEISSINLRTAAGSQLSTSAHSSTSFTVNATTGQLSNTAAIDFVIGAEDVGETVAIVSINDSSVAEMLRIDLETSILLTTEGTATISIGDLTADL